MTLVELIVAIVVIAIAVGSVLSVLSASAVRSSEVLVREQATMLASSYLDQVRSQSFALVPGSNGRAYWWPAGTTQYKTSISVAPAPLGGAPAAESYRINVTVTHSSGVTVLLSGYRMLYP
jgi:type II secretory pathway pseudopilin PulG